MAKKKKDELDPSIVKRLAGLADTIEGIDEVETEAEARELLAPFLEENGVDNTETEELITVIEMAEAFVPSGEEVASPDEDEDDEEEDDEDEEDEEDEDEEEKPAPKSKAKAKPAPEPVKPAKKSKKVVEEDDDDEEEEEPKPKKKAKPEPEPVKVKAKKKVVEEEDDEEEEDEEDTKAARLAKESKGVKQEQNKAKADKKAATAKEKKPKKSSSDFDINAGIKEVMEEFEGIFPEDEYELKELSNGVSVYLRGLNNYCIFTFKRLKKAEGGDMAGEFSFNRAKTWNDLDGFKLKVAEDNRFQRRFARIKNISLEEVMSKVLTKKVVDHFTEKQEKLKDKLEKNREELEKSVEKSAASNSKPIEKKKKAK